jgi:hypothetical protein
VNIKHCQLTSAQEIVQKVGGGWVGDDVVMGVFFIIINGVIDEFILRYSDSALKSNVYKKKST